MKRFVIIGGGIAGTTAAETLRKLSPEASVSLIEREEHPLYSRVLLAKYVMGEISREKLFLKKPEWYQKNNIERFAGVEVEKIDRKNHFIATSEGREIPYDVLLITSGLDVNLLPFDLRGICYLRTLDDAEYLRGLIADRVAQGEKSVAVMGGSFISGEFLNIFSHFGFEISLILRSGFWSRSLSPESQKIIVDHLESKGIHIYYSKDDIECEGKEELQSLNFENQKIPASILGVGIGLHADFSLFEDSGIDVGKGILANEYLETNAPDIFAAGDIAEFNDLTIKRSRMAPSWTSAVMQARTVAQTMMGERTLFESVSSYATWILGLDIVFLGDTLREAADDVKVNVSSGKSEELFYRKGKLVGAALIGDVSRRQELTNEIKDN
ncbi:MAG: FAD-dependent oxidoreductase [Patescibacteria group bacterium]|jgi:NAD(P)H-nitrite reductase large subunit